MKNSKITLCAIFASLAIVFGYIETLFSVPVAIPGIKWGLGNIVILVALYSLGNRYAFLIMLIKVLASSLLFASPSVLIYSLFGGVLSFLIMLLLKRFDFNMVMVSIGGGISHNTGQLLCASIIMRTLSVFYYLPVLLLSGALSAVVTGILAKIIIKRILS